MVAGAHVSIRGVTKTYTSSDGRPLPALDELSLDIAPGETVAVLGPSGCGKSTLLRMLCGIDRPTSGVIEVESTVVTRPRRDVGVAFQRADLLEWRTIRDNIGMGARLQRRPRCETAELVDRLLELVGLSDYAGRYPHELSGGMQQRAAVARALAIEPSLLLLDEPFGALDALTREHLNVELSRLCEDSGVSTLLITHSIDEAVFLADRVVVLSERPGRIVDVVDIDVPGARSLEFFQRSVFVEATARLRTWFGAPVVAAVQ